MGCSNSFVFSHEISAEGPLPGARGSPPLSERLTVTGDAASVSIPLAALFYGPFLLVAGSSCAAPSFAGFVFGYICYDEIHYATHHAPTKGRLGQFLRHHHVLRHYKDPDQQSGVGSPLWDHVFGTAGQSSEQIAVDG